MIERYTLRWERRFGVVWIIEPETIARSFGSLPVGAEFEFLGEPFTKLTRYSAWGEWSTTKAFWPSVPVQVSR